MCTYIKFRHNNLDDTEYSIDEEQVREAEKYDGYYAVITDREELRTKEAVEIYRDLWKIEDSFRILKSDIAARPVFVWTDDHVKGHFALCNLSLYMIRYIQYLLTENGAGTLSAKEIMNSIHSPLALAQGEYPKILVTPTEVPKTYLKISQILNMPELLTNMTLTKFRSTTKLDLSINLSHF